jgi:hypothetical protein
MKVIGTKTHGFLDYLTALLLIVAPLLLTSNYNTAETWVPVTLGVLTIIYSLMTNYELGVSRLIPMRYHLLLDIANGVILALSPWLFGFADHIWVPYVLTGIAEIIISSLTKPVPSTSRILSGSRSLN